jgi:ATP-dependent exoDNAse (exonuclease V) beta subunit
MRFADSIIPASLSDPKFSFEEERHLYWYDGQPLRSATSWLKQFQRPFDEEYWIQRKAIEKGITVRQLRKIWNDKRETSSELGTAVHKAIENKLLGKRLPIMSPEVNARYNLFLKLWNGRLKGSKAVASELRTFSVRYGLAGTLDLLLQLKDKKLYIGDWKTNEKFTSGDEGFGFLLPPFDRLKDNKLNEYAIQVALYRVLLEDHGLEIDGAFICHLPPFGPDPVVHFAPDLRKLVLSVLNGKVEEPLW